MMIDKMDRRLLTGILVVICHLSFSISAIAQGIPVIRNYSAEEYGAHNRNLDIEIGKDGTVFVANFEGLLYYDRAQWRIIHTPNINRLTVVYRAADNVIWVGGYNYFGRVQKKSNGELYLERVGKLDSFRGEILEIYEDQGKVRFLASNQKLYEVNGNNVSVVKSTNAFITSGLTHDIINVDALKEGKDVSILTDILQVEQLDDNLQVQVKNNQGLIFTDKAGNTLYTITEANGLCSNEVVWIEYDGHGILWGATAHGIFSIEVPSPYSLFLPKEGMSGEVHSILEWRGRMYVGTSNGLYRQEGMTFMPVAGFDFCCWKLAESPNGMLAVTSNGIFAFTSPTDYRQLTDAVTLDVLVDNHVVYSGEQDAVYLYRIGQKKEKVCDLEQVSKILKDDQGTLWLQNTYGEVYFLPVGSDMFQPFKVGSAEHDAATIVLVGNKVQVVSAVDTKPFPYPSFSTIGPDGMTWLTDNDGKHLYQWKDGMRLTELDRLLAPYSDMVVSALYHKNNEIWIGGDNALAIINLNKQKQADLTTHSRLLFRSVILGADSVLWGGYGEQPKELPRLASDERSLRFTYALEYAPLVGTTFYRYRLNNGSWSAWTEDNDAKFQNLSHGAYTLSVQARHPNGELSEVATVGFSIAYPIYMRWYMVVLYFILFVMLVFAFFRLRLKKLHQDKLKLEKIVQERTSEIVKQKDEIEEKSKSLEKALDDLNNAQNELIRQEKMATVGKLTQGLIDRILNPLNYINNFSKLSQGLVKDIEANIEDDKDKMDEENYEDTMDVLDMLRGNLEKVSEHGQNTTRTLKAMEEMLKDRTAGYVDMDLLPILKQDEEMLHNYYADDIAKYHISVSFNVPDKELMLHGNPELLSRTLMSMLGNAIYAVVKKAQRIQFEGIVSLTLTDDDDRYTLKIHDNGIGIEETIIDKVFDPFFTTKTTGEAAGVGLYLSREIIQNHGGDISAESIKDEYATFTILLPKVKIEN
jgi:signal transduction histidine kinase